MRTTLRRLELALLRTETRRSRAALEALLDGDFTEIGASGKSYDKAAVLAALKAEPEARFSLRDFSAAPLGDAASLVTFTLVKRVKGAKAAASRRWSVWRKAAGAWRLLHHQGVALAQR